MSQRSINLFVHSILNVQQTIGATTKKDHAELVQTQVYVGLNDADTRSQEHATEHYVSMLKGICVQHGVPFSFDVVNGGYIHDDGTYMEENTIVLTFIDIDQDTVDQIPRTYVRSSTKSPCSLPPAVFKRVPSAKSPSNC